MLFSLGLSSHPVRPSLVRLVIPGRFAFTLFTASGFLFLSFSLFIHWTNERMSGVCVCVCEIQLCDRFPTIPLPVVYTYHTIDLKRKKKQLSDTKDPVLISSKKFRMSIIAERIYLFYFPTNEKKEWGKIKVIDGMRDKSEPAPACRSQWQQIIQCRYHFSPSDSVSQPATHIYPLLTI